MGFYEEISKYYDDIFPTGKAQLAFIAEIAGEPPKNLLDIACGTGGYATALAKQGYQVTAVDLDKQMIFQLKRKAMDEKLNLNAMEGDMLELGEKLEAGYDLAFCIGNSLVHLNGNQEIGKFFNGVKGLLTEGGSLVIQIINYDRVLSKEIKALPTIENEEAGLSFQRLYRYDGQSNKILFKTILRVDGNEIENEIPLHPILADELVKLLKAAGFENIELYGDFAGASFDKDSSYALVVVAV